MKQAASDIGENTIVSRTGGATTFAMGMANFLKSYLGGHDSMAFWYHFAIMFEALFILTTVDNAPAWPVIRLVSCWATCAS